MSGSNKDNKISNDEFKKRLEEIVGKGNVSKENIDAKKKLKEELESLAEGSTLRMDTQEKNSNLSAKKIRSKTIEKLKNSKAYKNLKDVINRRKIERQAKRKLKKLDTEVSVEMHPSSKLQLTPDYSANSMDEISEDVLGFAERVKEIDAVPKKYSAIPVKLPIPAPLWDKNLKSLYRKDERFLTDCWALCIDMVGKVSKDVKNVYTKLRNLLNPSEIQRLNDASLSDLAEKLYNSEFLLALKNNYKKMIELTLNTYFKGTELKNFYYEYAVIKLSMTKLSSIPEYIEGKPPGANKKVRYSTSEWPKTGETPLTYIQRMGAKMKGSISSSYCKLLVSVLGPCTTLPAMFLDWRNSLVKEFKRAKIDVSIEDLMS